MFRSIILYRGLDFEREELDHAQKYFPCTNRRPAIQAGDLVIGRYSVYPFYADQEKDMQYVGAKFINSYAQHRYVADLQNYVYDLGDLTPKTWDDLSAIPETGPFVLKGETNSRKFTWNKDMFALTKKDAIEVYSRLCEDGLVGHQKIYIRQYVPLVSYFTGLGGIPISKEFRFFVAYGQIISGGYYWESHLDALKEVPAPEEVPLDFLQKAIDKIGNKINFYTIDVAQTLDGHWIVIELNDAQMAGLSCNKPEVLYKNLARVIS